jgi:transcriptional antiterminator RfaH
MNGAAERRLHRFMTTSNDIFASSRGLSCPPDDARVQALRSGPRWFLVFTKPSSESTAKTNLERQNYHVYYPRLLRPSLHRGRWVDRVVSLFPRYLFARVDAERQSLAPVRSTFGVVDVVRFGSQPAIVSDAIVEDLIERADAQSGLHRLSCRSRFEHGMRVNVIAGAFEGLDGIFEREAGSDRVVILLELLGRRTPVGVPSRYVISSIA